MKEIGEIMLLRILMIAALGVGHANRSSACEADKTASGNDAMEARITAAGSESKSSPSHHVHKHDHRSALKRPSIEKHRAEEFVNQDGLPFSLGDLPGKPWVVGFIFIRCTDICPTMVNNLIHLKNKFVNEDVGFLAISVDPEHDTPEILKNYARKFRQNDNRLTFLTGSKDAILDLANKKFKLGASKDPRVHSGRFVLLNKDADIHGYYQSSEAEDMKKLAMALSEMNSRGPS